MKDTKVAIQQNIEVIEVILSELKSLDDCANLEQSLLMMLAEFLHLYKDKQNPELRIAALTEIFMQVSYQILKGDVVIMPESSKSRMH